MGTSPRFRSHLCGAVGVVGLLLTACTDATDDAQTTADAASESVQRTRARASPGATPPAPSGTGARSPLLADGIPEGWVPDDAAVAEAAALADPATREAAWDAIHDRTDADRIEILRTGLRLRDATAARTAAFGLESQHLDAWELGRFVRLRTDAVLDPAFTLPQGERPTLGDLYEAAGWEDVAAILDRLSALPTDATPPDLEGLAALHKAARVGTLDAIVRTLRTRDAPGSAEALEMLWQIAVHTDRRREDVAAALLGLTPEEAKSRLPDARDLLTAALATDRADAAHYGEGFRNWGGRWRVELGPTAAEVEEAKAAFEGVEVCLSSEAVALWALRERPNDLKRFLLGARPGSGEAHLGTEDSDGLVAEEEGFGQLEILAGALAIVIPWDPSIDATFRDFDAFALGGTRLSARHLATIATTVPGCRTRRLADAVLARVPDDRWPFEPFDLGSAECDPTLPFLETCAPEAFLHRLRRWSASADADTRASASHALLVLRDVPSAPAIVRWAEEVREQNHAAVPWQAIGDLPHLAARAFLVRHVEAADDGFPPSVRQAIAAIAWFDGVRCSAEWTVVVPTDAMPEVARLVVAGRGADALFGAADALPFPFYEGMSEVRDPRTIPYLRGLRDQRSLGVYARVTGELALAGDEEAREEVLQVIRSGRYRWIEGMTDRERSLGDPVAMVPLWLEALESNCCAEPTVLGWFQDTFGVPEMGEDGYEATVAARVRAFFDRHGNRFVESRLAGRWVPAPR